MKLPTMVPVRSSNLKAIGHDGSALFVQFGNGIYRYGGVPKSVYDAGLKADSPGGWLQSSVKGLFEGIRVDAETKSSGTGGQERENG